MNARIKRDGQGWTVSILLHLAIVGAIFGAWYWTAHRPRPVESLGIDARVVSGDALSDTVTQLPPEPEPEATPALQDEPQEPPPEPGPSPEEVAAQAAAEQRVAEERRLAAEREVAERKAAAEKTERERKEKEKAAREKADKEKAEKAERERLARELAEKEAADKARRQREDALSAQLADEERIAAVRASGLANQYIAQIKAKIERVWKPPASARPGIDCEVRVTQIPGGVVTGVQVVRCNGDDAVRQSIENAVYGASPLPDPPDPALFDRNLRFNFKPTK